MCIITYGFVAEAKYNMGSIGYKPKEEKDYNLEIVKQLIVEQMFRLKNTSDAFFLSYYYSWIVSHWKKILKAKNHYKWNASGISYSKSDIKKNKELNYCISFSTNLFGGKNDVYYLDDKANIVHDVIEKTKKSDKELESCEVVKINDEISGLFEKQYLKTLKKKKNADIDKALAKVQTITLDYKKGIFICFITLNQNNISQTSLVKYAKQELNKAIKQATTIKTMQLMSTLTIINSINTINRLRRY